jgi:hypothetical protein
MAKTKISEYSSTAADNTDISNINIAEGCSPANLNNAVRSLMAQLKDQQAGTSGDGFTVAGTLTSSGTLAVTGGVTLDGSAGTSGQILLSAGSSNTPTWGNIFVAGMIMMWSGTIATIPSGWYLCNGSNGTPDLRNRFIVGAHSDTAGVAYTTITGSNTQSGGTKDSIVVSHTHTATVTDPTHFHTSTDALDGYNLGGYSRGYDVMSETTGYATSNVKTANAATGITVANSTEGSSGTNQNLPPYYALAFIMKA